MAGVIKEHSNMMPESGTGQAGWEVKGGCDPGTRGWIRVRGVRPKAIIQDLLQAWSSEVAPTLHA